MKKRNMRILALAVLAIVVLLLVGCGPERPAHKACVLVPPGTIVGHDSGVVFVDEDGTTYLWNKILLPAGGAVVPWSHYIYLIEMGVLLEPSGKVKSDEFISDKQNQ